MEWWRILFAIAVMAFISVGITKNMIVQGIAILLVGLLIYTRK
jgi:hypothetical protein